MAVTSASQVWSAKITVSPTAPTQHTKAAVAPSCRLLCPVPPPPILAAAISRGANTRIGAATRMPLGLIGIVSPTTSASHPSAAGRRARHARARAAVTPSATYDSGRVPRLNGSHATSRQTAASIRTRAVPARPGRAAPSTPRLITNQVAAASRVLGNRSHSGAMLIWVSGASSCWLKANGTSAASHHR